MPRREGPVIKIGPRVYQPTVLRIAFISFDEADNLIHFAMGGNGGETTQPHFVNGPAAQRMFSKAHGGLFAQICRKSIGLGHGAKLSPSAVLRAAFHPCKKRPPALPVSPGSADAAIARTTSSAGILSLQTYMQNAVFL
jgi:hypothetical protein